MHTKQKKNRRCKDVWMRRRDSFWECKLMFPRMFRTLATNFQDGSWIYRLMDFESIGM